jgi:hypothetical protein
VEHLAGELGHRPSLRAGVAPQLLEGGLRRRALPFGEHPDGALGGDPGGQGVLELGDGALERGQPDVPGVGVGVGVAGGTAGGPTRAAVGLDLRAQLLADQVGEGHALDEVADVLGAAGGEHRPAAAGPGDHHGGLRDGRVVRRRSVLQPGTHEVSSEPDDVDVGGHCAGVVRSLTGRPPRGAGPGG